MRICQFNLKSRTIQRDAPFFNQAVTQTVSLRRGLDAIHSHRKTKRGRRAANPRGVVAVRVTAVKCPPWFLDTYLEGERDERCPLNDSIEDKDSAGL